ncbi:MAG: SPOR domain-containing protein [Gammaproteobacteria bacterium]|nr:SPOR domain-containing protein [Gammaproteobacteria bacterium]
MAQASRKKETRRPGLPAWVWFVAGLTAGAVSMNLVQSTDSRNLQQKLQDRLSAQTQPQQPAEESKAPKPRFDFYTVLPEMEVVVPEEEIQKPPKPEPPAAKPTTPAAQVAQASTPAAVPAAAKKPEPAKPAKPAQAEVFLLQMGSFASFDDADNLQARLGFIGVSSDIQSVPIANAQGKRSMHRVRGGPYSQAEVQALHSTLKANGINAMVIKLKK